MATIKSVVVRGTGRAGKWRVEWDDFGSSGATIHSLYHYSTKMLEWIQFANGRVLVGWSTGHGSVSDQQGMNIAFKALGFHYYYSRRGGASIARIHEGCSHCESSVVN